MRAAPLLVLALLAGCLGGAGEEAPAAVGEAVNASAGTPLAPPDNRSGGFAAFEETNATTVGAHRHDAWQGRTRVEILRERVGMALSGDRDAVAVARPPEGDAFLVFEGAGSVEVVLSRPERRACETAAVVNGEFVCTPGVPDPAPPAALAVEVQHAASDPDEWLPVGEAAWGAPLVVPVEDATWTDMPHATASLWAFRFRAPDAHEATLTFEAAVTIVRAEGEIPEWPGHPDFYAAGPERVVMEARATTRDGLLGFETGDVTPQRLVSWGTRTLAVHVNVTRVEGLARPTHWALQFHNASGRFWNMTEYAAAGTTVDRTSLTWLLAVDENGMDAPYAPRSRWEVALRGVAGNCVGGCADYVVEYEVRVVASREPAEAYAATLKWGPR